MPYAWHQAALRWTFLRMRPTITYGLRRALCSINSEDPVSNFKNDDAMHIRHLEFSSRAVVNRSDRSFTALCEPSELVPRDRLGRRWPAAYINRAGSVSLRRAA
jgi:hypothetical protein